MSLNRTRAQDLDLGSLLDGIHSGSIVLPDFQRDFDWSDRDVRALLATVLSGWPIGSLLLMKGPPTFFRVRPIEGAPPPSSEHNVAYIVLDGQQRLTGLYQALYDQGDLVYAMRISSLIGQQDIDSLDQAIVTVKRDTWVRRSKTPRNQLENDLLPLSALRSATDFFNWRDEATGGAANLPITPNELTALYRDFLAGLHNYNIQAVVVESNVEPAAIARIFERVNRMGMPLGTFDLMVARSYAPDFNLRLAWERAREAYPILQSFYGDDGLPILNVIALRQVRDVRQRSVLNLSGTTVRDHWNEAVEHVEQAITFAVRDLGVWQPEWLPYKNALTILAALSHNLDLNDERSRLKSWFWDTAFGRKYDVASNTRSVSDYIRLLEGGSSVGSRLTIEKELFLDSNRRQQGTLHRSFLCAIAANDPIDPTTGVVLSKTGSVEDGVLPDAVAVSVFRSSTTPTVATPNHLRTLGFVLTQRSSMRHLSPQIVNSARFDVLRRTLILPDARDTADAEDFFEGRLGALQGFMEREIGLRVRIIESDEVI